MDTYGYAPCEYEDSPGPCYWDASTMGNGVGQSYVVHADGTVEYGNAYYPPGWSIPTEPLPAPLSLTTQPVTYDELAYTGSEDVLTGLLLAGVVLIAAGVAAIRRFR